MIQFTVTYNMYLESTGARAKLRAGLLAVWPEGGPLVVSEKDRRIYT